MSTKFISFSFFSLIKKSAVTVYKIFVEGTVEESFYFINHTFFLFYILDHFIFISQTFFLSFFHSFIWFNHVGQKSAVTVYKIIVEGTVEESVVKQQESKGYLQSALNINDKDSNWRIERKKEMFLAGIITF